jgi:hypothetical protein
MYIFGIDIPLVEIILAVGVIGIILLLEITVVLLLISYHLKNSKKLEDKVGFLLNALSSLNKAELQELQKIKEIKGRKFFSKVKEKPKKVKSKKK